jgi:uncharacterized protein YbjT (DUF2867 family)
VLDIDCPSHEKVLAAGHRPESRREWQELSKPPRADVEERNSAGGKVQHRERRVVDDSQRGRELQFSRALALGAEVSDALAASVISSMSLSPARAMPAGSFSTTAL